MYVYIYAFLRCARSLTILLCTAIVGPSKEGPNLASLLAPQLLRFPHCICILSYIRTVSLLPNLPPSHSVPLLERQLS